MKKNIQVAVVGASGKMGQEIFSVLKEKRISSFGVTQSGKADQYDKTYKWQLAPFRQAQVIIDFSLPVAFENTLQAAVENKIPLICGTTGLGDAQLLKLQAASKKIPILWSANMSLGIALLKKALQGFSCVEGFDFQIIELHHNQKKDSPSGTAIQLQKALIKTTGKKIPAVLSIRAGGIVGTHQIHAVSKYEHITFQHEAMSRKVFAEGAVQAMIWLLEKNKPGLYSIEDVLDGK